MDTSVEKLWRKETRSRIAEVKNSSVQGIPEEIVSARIDQLINS